VTENTASLEQEQHEVPAVAVGSRLSVFRQSLFQQSSLSLEERPVFFEHLLFQLQRCLYRDHIKHDRQTHTDGWTDRETEWCLNTTTHPVCQAVYQAVIDETLAHGIHTYWQPQL